MDIIISEISLKKWIDKQSEEISVFGPHIVVRLAQRNMNSWVDLQDELVEKMNLVTSQTLIFEASGFAYVRGLPHLVFMKHFKHFLELLIPEIDHSWRSDLTDMKQKSVPPNTSSGKIPSDIIDLRKNFTFSTRKKKVYLVSADTTKSRKSFPDKKNWIKRKLHKNHYKHLDEVSKEVFSYSQKTIESLIKVDFIVEYLKAHKELVYTKWVEMTDVRTRTNEKLFLSELFGLNIDLTYMELKKNSGSIDWHIKNTILQIWLDMVNESNKKIINNLEACELWKDVLDDTTEEFPEEVLESIEKMLGFNLKTGVKRRDVL